MRYRVVTTLGTVEHFDGLDALTARFAIAGRCTRRGLRPELQGQPLLVGLAGPMWDGDAVRYEAPAVAAALSAG